MKLQIIKIDKIIFQGEVSRIKAQSPDGGFEIYEGHAPMVAVLAPGNFHIEETNQETNQKTDQNISRDFLLAGGILKVLPHEAAVLAE